MTRYVIAYFAVVSLAAYVLGYAEGIVVLQPSLEDCPVKDFIENYVPGCPPPSWWELMKAHFLDSAVGQFAAFIINTLWAMVQLATLQLDLSLEMHAIILGIPSMMLAYEIVRDVRGG